MEILELLSEQTRGAEMALGHLEQARTDFVFDVEATVEELDDVWFVPELSATRMKNALSHLDEIRLPKPTPLQGKWSKLLVGVDLWSATNDATKRVEKVIQSRVNLLDRYRKVQTELASLKVTVTHLRDAVRAEADRMLNDNNAQRDFWVRFYDTISNYLIFRGMEVLDSIVEGLDDRVAQIETLEGFAKDATKLLEKELPELEASLQIMEFMGPDAGSDTSDIDTDIDGAFHRRAADIARNQSELVKKTAEAIRLRDNLMSEAGRAARRYSSMARWQQILSLASSLGSLADVISRGTPGGTVEVNGETFPVPADVLKKATSGLKLDIIMQLSGDAGHYVHSESRWVGRPD